MMGTLCGNGGLQPSNQGLLQTWQEAVVLGPVLPEVVEAACWHRPPCGEGSVEDPAEALAAL